MPFGLFKKRDEWTGKIEKGETKTFEEKEVEDLKKLGSLKEPTFDLKEPFPVEEIKPETVIPEAEPSKVEAPAETMGAPPISVEKTLTFEELPLKELCKDIKDGLKEIRDKFREIGKTDNLTLESPEMIDLLELYVIAKDKMQEFIDKINKLELGKLTSKKTVAAIYKFRACKTLADIKKQVRKIESICKKAGFIPTKIHEILEAKAEDLVNSFLREEKKEKKRSK